jgi:hypothetical protein
MDDGKTLRRALLTSMVMFAFSQLPACQAFDAPTVVEAWK